MGSSVVIPLLLLTKSYVWRLCGSFDGRAIDADKDGRRVCPHNIAGPLCFAGDVSGLS